MCQLQKAELYLLMYVASRLCFCNLSNSSSAWYHLGCYCLLLPQWYCPQINRIISLALPAWFASKSNELQGKSDCRVTAAEIGNICNIFLKIIVPSCHPPSRLTIRIRIIAGLHVGHAFHRHLSQTSYRSTHTEINWLKSDTIAHFCLSSLCFWPVEVATSENVK